MIDGCEVERRIVPAGPAGHITERTFKSFLALLLHIP